MRYHAGRQCLHLFPSQEATPHPITLTEASSRLTAAASRALAPASAALSLALMASSFTACPTLPVASCTREGRATGGCGWVDRRGKVWAGAALQGGRGSTAAPMRAGAECDCCAAGWQQEQPGATQEQAAPTLTRSAAPGRVSRTLLDMSLQGGGA